MFDLTLQTIFMRAGALVLIVAVQGMAIAAAAAVLGDPGPRQDGRLGPSPERHLDALGAAGLILFGLGWGRHVDVDARRLRGGPLTVVLVVLAGAAALFVAAVLLRYLVAPALTTMSGSGALVVAAFLRMAAALCLANAVFSLLPVPPLPGGHLLSLVGLQVPEHWLAVLGLGLLVLVASGAASGFIVTGVALLEPLVQGVSPR